MAAGSPISLPAARPLGFVAGAGRGTAAARRRTGHGVDRRFAALALLPTVLIMAAVFGIPLGFSFFLSLRGWSPGGSLLGGGFVGLDNYAELFSDPVFVRSLGLTVAYTACAVTAELLLGMAVALLLNRDVPLIGIFRTILIMPMMMTPIVAALCWKLLLDPQYGLVNALLGTRIVWVGDPAVAPFAVALVNVWQNVPYVAVLLLAGLRSLPTEPMEAARIDGAGPLQAFRHVTLPALRPAILTALLLRTIFEFRAFDNVYVMTGGGPAGATNLLSIFTYTLTFGSFDFSLGAASSWVMLAACLALCSVPLLLFRGRRA